MADRLSLILAAVLLAPGASAQAQGALPDPTRPPAVLNAPAAEGGANPAVAEVAVGPVLQSVFMPKKGRPVAIISGKTVRLGESYEGRRLIRLSEKEAVLEGAAGRERLSLTPAVEKTPIIPRKSAPRRAPGGGPS